MDLFKNENVASFDWAEIAFRLHKSDNSQLGLKSRHHLCILAHLVRSVMSAFSRKHDSEGDCV